MSLSLIYSRTVRGQHRLSVPASASLRPPFVVLVDTIASPRLASHRIASHRHDLTRVAPPLLRCCSSCLALLLLLLVVLLAGLALSCGPSCSCLELHHNNNNNNDISREKGRYLSWFGSPEWGRSSRTRDLSSSPRNRIDAWLRLDVTHRHEAPRYS